MVRCCQVGNGVIVGVEGLLGLVCQGADRWIGIMIQVGQLRLRLDGVNTMR